MPFFLVTGATGYIAQHVINLLLDKGHKVIGTVRSQAKADIVSELFENDDLVLEVVPELADSGAFDELFKKYTTQIEHVIHTASPVRYDKTDLEKDILLPAVNGTKSVLESIKRYSADSVKTVVYTSSCAALSNPSGLRVPGATVNEESWNPDSWEQAQADPYTAYYGSKTFAERAAWEFIGENRENVKFQLTTVCPAYVLGPHYFNDNAKGSVLNYSSELINAILKSKPEDKIDQDFAGAFIDVRDVAKAHVLPLENSNLASKRLAVFNHMFALQDVADIIHAKFPELRGKIAAGNPGAGPNIIRGITQYENQKSKELLGLEFISLEQSVTDSVEQLFAANP